MSVVALCENLVQLGGAEKHGLMLLEPLAGRCGVVVCYRDDKGSFDPNVLRERFGRDLSGFEFRPCWSTREVLRQARRAELFVNLTYASLVPNVARRGILLVYFPLPIVDHPRPPLWARLGHGVESLRQRVLARIEDWDPDLVRSETRRFRHYASRHGTLRTASRVPLFLLRKLATTGFRDLRLGAAALGSYDRILANSRFTAGWIDRIYGRTADVTYPPIDTHRFRAGEKRPEVLAVGRFDNGENSKKFHVLIEAFKRSHDRALLTGWTMHVCGGVGSPQSAAYLAELRTQAAGYPVEFHPNLPLMELAARYESASLFWHAMGYGENPDRHPWRCEHFGMTTAEAMAAGCIPMAIRAGGQPEVVGGPECGYLWETIDQLLETVSRFLALSPDEVKRMRVAAQNQAETFGLPAFYRRTIEMYQRLGFSCRRTEELIPTFEPVVV